MWLCQSWQKPLAVGIVCWLVPLKRKQIFRQLDIITDARSLLSATEVEAIEIVRLTSRAGLRWLKVLFRIPRELFLSLLRLYVWLTYVRILKLFSTYICIRWAGLGQVGLGRVGVWSDLNGSGWIGSKHWRVGSEKSDPWPTLWWGRVPPSPRGLRLWLAESKTFLNRTNDEFNVVCKRQWKGWHI